MVSVFIYIYISLLNILFFYIFIIIIIILLYYYLLIIVSSENENNNIVDSKNKANILELSISTAEDKIVFYTNKEHSEDETNSSLIAKSLIYEYEKYIQSNLNISCYQLLENGTKKELIDPSTSSKIKFNIVIIIQ